MCRCPGCDRTPDTGRFCSDRCEVKFDKLRSDVPGPEEEWH